MESSFRAGFVSLLGRPNAGKSTLLNKLVGAKLAAVSALPQTTRQRFHGILSDEKRQIVFVDLPGLMEPDDLLNKALRENVAEGLEGVDVVVHLVDVADPTPIPAEMKTLVLEMRTPVILAVNKLDGRHATTDAANWALNSLPRLVREKYTAIVGLSARSGTGLDSLLAAIDPHLVEGPPLFDPENLTDRDMRFLAQELIREKVFHHLHEEIPYSVAVQVEDFQEREEGKWYVAATIYVERESQKGMVIGKGGAMLRRISTEARFDIEKLCDAPVFLELWVKVREKWRKSEKALSEFGYRTKKKKRS